MESVPSQLAMDQLVAMVQNLQTLCRTHCEIKKGKKGNACGGCRIGRLQCVVTMREVVPVGSKGNEVLEIVLARSLEDAGDQRLLARLGGQSDELDGAHKVLACWI
jgi:hypothetical protein